MRRTVKPLPMPSRASQCLGSTESEGESLDYHQSIVSSDDARVHPMEIPTKRRKDGSVRVAVRIRPMLPRELVRNTATCVCMSKEAANAIVLSDGIERTYTFDHVFPQSSNQTEVYHTALGPWMASFLQGFNVTVIAYGQTGSGKTYTMGNHSTSMMHTPRCVTSFSLADSHEEVADGLDSEDGLIPHFLSHLFSQLQDTASNCQLSVSFLEIYGEEIRDLLETSSVNRSEPLQVRENPKKGVWVQGLTEVCVSTRCEALAHMQRGALQRRTASTLMNERSSRSHAVYTVKIVQRVSANQRIEKAVKCTAVGLPHSHDKDSATDAVVVSKLTFVDLAGSERLKKTGAQGERMKEGIQINVGLFALGNVINALGDDKRKSHAHVPYRSSKLTRLLQEALGGNSRTLFIACVSPVDYNANETFNTLQYANRAKNIQNQAVKNIDSRSAQVAHLKAWNQILCRELVKAIVGENGQVAIQTEACMTNPTVLAYLNKLEQLSTAAGLEASCDEYYVEMQRLVHGLTTHLYALVPCKEYQRTLSLTSSNDENPRPQDDSIDFVSDSGSSVAILEDHVPGAEEGSELLYPLGTLCRTLEIMIAAFEMQEIQKYGTQQNDGYRAKIINLETRYHHQELLRAGLVGTIERMSTWLAAQAVQEKPVGPQSTIESNLKEAMEKLELMDVEMADLQHQIDELGRERSVQLMRYQKEWKAKQAQVEWIRETSKVITTNALSVMMRRAEIKVRFDGYDLKSIAEYLKEEEKEMAAFIDDKDAALSLVSPLFSIEELSLSYPHKIWSMIRDQLRIAFDKEVLEASMSKELHKRTQLIHNITTGFRACNWGEMTKQEFMETNEERLKNCEDYISEIRDAMRATQSQRATMSEILASIQSLDVAKGVIKRLIVENYSQSRMYRACEEEDTMRRQRRAEDGANQRLQSIKVAMDKKIKNLEAKYANDVQCAYQMVTSFDHAVRSVMQFKSPADAQGVCDEKERERMFVTKLAEKEEQLATTRAALTRFQASAKSMEMKEELFPLIRRCQEIWKELGVNEDEQASKLQDINKLLMKKCSEILEGLEAARGKLRACINDTYQVVYRLECVLHTVDRVDIHSLSSVAGETLLEQERYLLVRRKHLSHDLWQRVKAWSRVAEGIRCLVADLQVRTIEDFCHVSQNEVGIFDADVIESATPELIGWKHFQENQEDVNALDQVLESLGDGARISNLSKQQNEQLFNALLTEKTKRLVELEQSLETIRSVAQNAQLSRSDIMFVIHAFHEVHGDKATVNDNGTNVVDELCTWIFQTGGQLDVSKHALEMLATMLREFQTIESGRLAALAFLDRTREEAIMVLHDIDVGDHAVEEATRLLFTCLLHQYTNHLQYKGMITDTLAAGKDMVIGLSKPVESLLRSLFYSTTDAFAAFGIDTAEHQVNFLLGSVDKRQEARRAMLEKYALCSTSEFTASERSTQELAEHCHDSLLSTLDPAFGTCGSVYSVSFGNSQLQRLRDSIVDMNEIQRTATSTQKRLGSLTKIMKIFTKINEFKAKIATFETSASQKERLFGNSLRLLEEERFRKLAAKHYPNLLALLRTEVTRWLKNEDGEFDLSVLGKDLKQLLLDMMHTDTGLMHLDLSTVRHCTKQARSSNATLQPLASGTAATLARGRTQSTHTPALTK